MSRQENYDKLDMLADLIEPMSAILTDKEPLKAWENGERARCASMMIKNHKPEVIAILAGLDGVDPEEYVLEPDVVLMKLIKKLNELLPLITELFPMFAQSADGASSGPATGNIEEDAQ